MAEQRVNADGKVVEFDEKSGRWLPVKEEVKETESNDPAPTTEDTLVDEGETTPRRARKTYK